MTQEHPDLIHRYQSGVLDVQALGVAGFQVQGGSQSSEGFVTRIQVAMLVYLMEHSRALRSELLAAVPVSTFEPSAMQHIIRACDQLTRQAEDVIVLEGPYDQPYQVLSPLWEVRSDVSRLLHELEHGDVLTALEQSGGACLRGLPDSAWVVRRRAELETAILGALEPLIAGAEAAGAAQDVVRLTSAGLRVLPEQRGLAERRLQAARACESEDGVASFQAELKMLGGA